MVQRRQRNSTAQRHISSPTPVPSASQHIKSAGRQAGTRSGTAGTCVWCGAVRHLLSGVLASNNKYGSTADELARKRRSDEGGHSGQGWSGLALPHADAGEYVGHQRTRPNRGQCRQTGPTTCPLMLFTVHKTCRVVSGSIRRVPSDAAPWLVSVSRTTCQPLLPSIVPACHCKATAHGTPPTVRAAAGARGIRGS